MTREELVERVARAIIEADGNNPDVSPDDDGIPWWVDYKPNARAAISVVVEECARVAEGVYPRGSAHTYASENADAYIAQEMACEQCAAAIRKLGEPT